MYIIIFVINVALEHKITHIPQYYRSNSCASKSARVLLLLRRRRARTPAGFRGRAAARCLRPGPGFPARARGAPQPLPPPGVSDPPQGHGAPLRAATVGTLGGPCCVPVSGQQAGVGLNKAVSHPETPPPGPMVGTQEQGRTGQTSVRQDLQLAGPQA